VLSLFLAAARIPPALAAPQAAAAPPSTPAKRPAAPAPSFDSLAEKAAAARKAERYDDAIGYYRQALKLKPDWLEGRFTLGTLLYDQERYAEARDELRRVSQADPKNGLILALKGLSEFQLRSYERALKDLQSARALGVPSVEVMAAASYHAAILLTRMEQYEAAFDILREFARQEKDTPTVIEAFGLSILRMPFLPSEAPGDRREMILIAGRAGFHQAKGRTSAYGRQAYEELVSRYPTAPNVHYAFGAYLLAEQPDAAIEEFKRELKLAPNHYQAMLQIAYELHKQGKQEEARPWAEKATELAPSLFAAHNILGRILLELGETEKAIAALETGVKLAPDSPEVRFSLARAYTRAGRTEEATRERAAFVKLERARRTARSGPQSVGGKEEEPSEPETPPRE
jgi:tetratricopeptide (TPR) repeat protein